MFSEEPYLYPLKFTPLFFDKIWGGNKIKTLLNLDFSPLPNCGEVWVLSGVEGKESIVSNGYLKDNTLNELVEVYMSDLVGDKVYGKFGPEFPLLIKFIDANEALSIQVHPDDELAQKRGGKYGKTEMWYILQADKGAQLINGFGTEMDEKKYLQHLQDKTLKDVLNFETIEKGDTFFIPAGRVHALGSGMLLAEIQQTSDITYRIYDWDRVDDKGKPRELHTAEALDAINYEKNINTKVQYNSEINKTISVVDCPMFTTNILSFDKNIQKDYFKLDSFVLYICTEGNCNITALNTEISIQKGEVILLPAITQQVDLTPKTFCNILEVYIQ